MQCVAQLDLINLFLFSVSVEGEPHEKAVELLKAAISSVKLVVRLVFSLSFFVSLSFFLSLFFLAISLFCACIYYISYSLSLLLSV